MTSKPVAMLLAGAMLAGCTQSMYPTAEQLREEANAQIEPNLEEKLTCVGEKMPRLSVTVAKIPDLTGKVTISDGGDGAYVTQGAQYQAMAVLERMKNITVVNTANYDLERIVTARTGKNYRWKAPPRAYVSGAITRIDFVPGAAVEGGVGAVQLGVREFGVIIGADLFLTKYSDSQVVESATVEVRLKGSELKLAVADMLGSRFATAGADVRRRAALQIGTESLMKAGMLKLFTPLARGACENSTEGNDT